MAFVDVAALSVIVALIRRGRILRLADLQIERLWLVFVPLGVLVASVLCRKFAPPNVWGPVTGGLHVVTSVALLAFFWSNRRLPGMKWLLAGWLLNFIPIIANGGKMPVSEWAVTIASHGKPQAAMLQHTLISSHTRFNFLADIIPGPAPPLIRPEVASPGDVLMALGIFWLIQVTMCSRKRDGGG